MEGLAEEIKEAADLYVTQHVSCECGLEGKSSCESCAETKKGVFAAYVTGLSCATAFAGKPISAKTIREACNKALLLGGIPVE